MICGMDKPAPSEKKADMERALRRQVRSAMELAIGEILFVDKNWIVRSANGKIARAANLEKLKKMTRPS